MKIPELRELIKKDSTKVNEMLIEVYKLLPKEKKAEADVIIDNILNGNKNVKKGQVVNTIDLQAFFNEIEYFIDCARADYYFAPNRVVPKSERPKWRFKVKKYVKILNTITIDSPYFEASIQALIDLYRLLSYGCGYYIFNSEDTFASVGIEQPQFYQYIVNKMIQRKLSEENLMTLIDLAVNVYLSRESLHIYMIGVLYQKLSEEDQMRTLEAAKEYMKQLFSNQKPHPLQSYSVESLANEINELIFAFESKNGLTKQAMDYFYTHSKERDNEVKLYIMLNIIDSWYDEEDWLTCYEYALKKKIKPRSRLQEEYTERKKK